MTPSHHDKVPGPTRLRPKTGDSTPPRSGRTPFESAIYHPTSLFRRLLNQSARSRSSTGAAPVECSPQPAMSRRAPRLLAFLGLAFLVGVASGFLELAVREIMVHVQHRIGWHSLMASRHVTWMVPATAPLVIVPLSVILVGPTFTLLAWRSRRGRRASTEAEAWAGGWVGTVLGTLLVVGPLLAARVLHPAEAVALALGLGFDSGTG